MASTVVHISFAIIIACALIPIDKFSYKSLLLVILPVAFLDIDAMAFIIKEGMHRTLLHNIIIPSIFIIGIYYDIFIREKSFIEKYYAKKYVLIISTTSYIAVIFSGIGLDFASNGVNLFWPIYDRFYTLDGQFVLSSKDGLIQTFTDTFFENKNIKTTENHIYSTPVNPNPESNDKSPLILHIAYTGWQIIIILTSIVLASIKSIYKIYL